MGIVCVYCSGATIVEKKWMQMCSAPIESRARFRFCLSSGDAQSDFEIFPLHYRNIGHMRLDLLDFKIF